MTTASLRVLVCGANGFIGSHVVAALERAGRGVICASLAPRRRDLPHVAVDFSRDTDPAAWLPRLKHVDTVVNAVGVLRDSGRRPMQAVQADTPAALFQAARAAGVRRIVHVSALGIGRGDADNATAYARTKRQAEAALASLGDDAPSWIALRPSVVLGAGGDATKLFATLGALPLLAMPGAALDARIQPVLVDDLADAIATLCDPASPERGVVEFGGPRVMTLAELIGSLRAARRTPAPPAAHVLRLPEWTGAVSARIGDLIPGLPWCTDTRTMLERDSVASSAPLERWLGRAPRDLREVAATLVRA